MKKRKGLCVTVIVTALVRTAPSINISNFLIKMSLAGPNISGPGKLLFKVILSNENKGTDLFFVR
jgi:hypothetical protein